MENQTQTAPSVSKMKWWGGALIVLAIIAMYFVSVFNGLTTANEAIDGQWAQVETQYQRRLDLIPSLVESVKGVMKQEVEVFGRLADARANYAGARTVDEKAAAAGQVDGALSRLLVVMENYPQLKSSENMQAFQAQLEGTENRISVERGRFNDLVRDYNLRIKRFPGNIFSGMFGFNVRTYFESQTGAENAPKVSF